MRGVAPGIVVVTAGVALGALAPAAGAAPVETIWSGWQSVGPAPGIDSGSTLATAGTTTFAMRSVQSSSGGDGQRHPFVVDAAGVQRAGTLTFAQSGQPAIAAPSQTRLVAQNGCEVQRSDDTGATWSTVALPDCQDMSGGTLAFSDANTGFAATGLRLWSTADGGVTWKPTGTVPSSQSSGYVMRPLVAVNATTLLQTPDGTSLRRSEDSGATWKVVPLPAQGGMLQTALPSVGAVVRRANGAILVGVRGGVLRSTDLGKTFTRTDTPTPPELAGAKDLDVPMIACDAASACVADIDDPGVSTRHQGLRYTDAGFGAPVMGLPRQASAPAANTIVGLLDLPTTTALVRSTNGGGSYAPVITGSTSLGSIGGDGLLSVIRGDRVSMSTDRGEVFTDAPLPGPSPILEDIAAPGGTLALTQDGKVSRLVGGAWQVVADATPIKPTALAVAGDVPVVVGARGVAVVSKPPAVALASAPALAGRGFSGVTARGKTILIWSGSRLVRSSDGGKRWKAQTLPGRITDATIVDKRFAFAIAGKRLVTSRNGGASFRGVGYPVPLGDGNGIDTAAFRDAKNGVTTGDAGLQITTDGGKSFRPVPTPGGTAPVFADSTGGGVLVQDRLSGDLYRFLTASKAASAKITLKLSGRAAPKKDRTTGKGKKKRTISSTVRVVGKITGIPLNGTVHVVTLSKKNGAQGEGGSAEVNADGSFTRKIRLDSSDRLVQVWYEGAVLPSGTIGGSSSKAVQVRK